MSLRLIVFLYSLVSAAICSHQWYTSGMASQETLNTVYRRSGPGDEPSHSKPQQSEGWRRLRQDDSASQPRRADHEGTDNPESAINRLGRVFSAFELSEVSPTLRREGSHPTSPTQNRARHDTVKFDFAMANEHRRVLTELMRLLQQSGELQHDREKAREAKKQLRAIRAGETYLKAEHIEALSKTATGRALVREVEAEHLREIPRFREAIARLKGKIESLRAASGSQRDAESSHDPAHAEMLRASETRRTRYANKAATDQVSEPKTVTKQGSEEVGTSAHETQNIEESSTGGQGKQSRTEKNRRKRARDKAKKAAKQETANRETIEGARRVPGPDKDESKDLEKGSSKSSRSRSPELG